MSATILPDDDRGRAAAIAALRQGRLVALPTDTVYGLAVALDAVGGLGRLFAAKRRPLDKAIVLLLADQHQADAVGLLDASAHVLASAFWPGGLTLVVPLRSDAGLPAELTGGAGTIGLRLAAHAAPRALAAAVGPLPVTSANRSGEPAATDAGEVLAQLGASPDLQ
ncbi:MAG: Sua5/YciO/YrdC/YwlC family protein, partial [Chloroflexota bacterium]|nr:Sua5/YciO/YrdC/YwlC family protein [Chloroflexota bacterium]